MKIVLCAISIVLRRALVAALMILAAQLAWAASPSEEYVYTIAKGDTMIGLSSRLLKSPADWPKVARYNRLPNPHYLVPGASLRIPLALLNHTLTGVTVAHVEGDVKAGSGANASPSVLALGATLAEGAQVTTGKDGYVTLKLQDGSTVRLRSGAQMQVERQRTYPDAGILESVMNLIAGRVESLVQKFRTGEIKETRHKVKTPLANLAVRGTEFRVTMDTSTSVTRGEVLAGAVTVAAEGAPTMEKNLEAGFGSIVDSGKSVSDPIALLAAPDTSKLAKLQERTLLRFPLPALDGARAYRAQLARDEAFNAVVAEVVSPSPDIRLADIADGGYFLRVRAVDARGLEGRDATHAFRLKARPEPPLASAPAPKSKVRATEVEFKWSENVEAATYHLQVAKDAAFTSLVHENKAAKSNQTTVGKLALGNYFWRVASIRKDGDRGPFGDVGGFTLLAPPALPEPPAVGDSAIQFRWAGEPGQKFEFQLADNAKFAKPLLTQTLDKPEMAVPRPGPGTYYMRFRATDPDGFVGPYSSVQRFSIPACLTDSAGRCVSSTFGVVSPAQ